ncbi:hypothetical protein [Secundilactobacillus yichangensis]|uniref:hypothetical protein n=1 Tax=Secundilactobacillus yichangensis TaxID=2799580 RepID=UPI001943ECDE|nr:hypothetical protein [Secundilactobacillus yichangensis]
MKQLIKVVLPLAVLSLLGGCGSQTKSHSGSTKPKTTKVAKKAADKVNSISDSSSKKTTADSDSSSQSEKTNQISGESGSSTQQQAKANHAQTAVTKAHPAVTQQTVANRISQSLSGRYAPQDLTFQFSQSGAGTYTVQVQENHQSPNMKAQGADPSTSPTIAWYKTNASGQLLKSVDGGVTYTIVGNAY